MANTASKWVEVDCSTMTIIMGGLHPDGHDLGIVYSASKKTIMVEGPNF